MVWRLSFVFALALLSSHGVLDADATGVHDAFWYQLHDGVSRLLTLTDANFNETLANSSLLVVWFRGSTPEGTVEPVQQKMALIYENMLELTSQFLLDQDVKVGLVHMPCNPLTTSQTGAPKDGSVQVFKQGRPYLYHGYRSAELLLSFIRTVNSTALRVISDKMSKKEFDDVESTKVIAYLTPGTAAYTEYETAALAMHPSVPFFVLHDPTFAPKVKLNTEGEIYVLRPGDAAKELIPPENATTAAGIQVFVSSKGRGVFNILTLNDLHTFGGPGEPGVHSVVAFSRRHSQEARQFFKALKNVARQFANETNLRITVVDPDILPMMAPHWQAKFGIDVTRPALGYVDWENGSHQWLDLTVFHSLQNQTEQRQILQDWINSTVLQPPVQEEPVICLPGPEGSPEQCIPLEQAKASLQDLLQQQQEQLQEQEQEKESRGPEGVELPKETPGGNRDEL